MKQLNTTIRQSSVSTRVRRRSLILSGMIGVSLLAVSSMAHAQNGPGGVNATVWYQADKASDILTTGNKVTGWKDSKGSGKDLGQSTVAWQPIYSNSGTLANFNPTIVWSGAQFLNTTGITTTNKIIDRAEGGIFVAGKMGNTVSQAGLAGFHATMDYPGLHTSNVNSQKQMLFFTGGPGYSGLSPIPLDENIFEPNTPFLGGAVWKNNTPGTYLNATVSLLGQRVSYDPTTTGKLNNVNMATTAEDFYVGGDNNWGNLNGQLHEVAVFDSKLSAADMDKVESYMAIKYGITYMNGMKNYVNSSGSVIWNATSNNGNSHNIAGIARDNNGGLYQKQSRSENLNQKLIIGLGSLANSNDANTGTLSDGQYLIWGDNGMAQKPGVAFSGSGLTHRFTSVWQVQNTNAVGTVRVAWPGTSFDAIKLIVSSDSTFASGNTVTDMTTNTTTINGVVYNYADVTLTDGQYFTFGILATTPGGIASLPAVWYKSENVAGNTWTDASINSIDLLSNVAGSTGPTINNGDQKHNFNTWTNKYSNVNYFNDVTGTSDVFGVWADGGGTTSASTDYGSGYYYMPLTVFGVARDTLTSGGSGLITGIDNELANASEPGFGVYGAKQRFYRFGNGAAASGDNAPINASAVYSWRPPAGGSTSPGTANLTMGLNGAYTNTLVNIRSSVAGPYVKIGYAAADWGAFPGDIQEVVWFKDSLSNADLEKVETYLSLKYGTTLAHDYVNAAGTAVYSLTTNAGYVSNIAGIAREDVNGKLYQKQSNSVNVGEKLVIGLTGLANTNDANTSTLNNGDFLIWGNNGLAQSFADYQPTLRPAHGINLLMKSVWKVQNTGAVGTVRVAWPEGDENLTLVQSSDATFDLSDQFTDMTANTITVNGITYNYADVTLADGEYFTFGSLIKHAPGGVFNGLSVWYRADIDATNTGAGTDVTQWTDYAKGVKASPFSTAAGTTPLPKYKDGDADYLNFNPGVNFTVADQKLGNIGMQLLTSLDFDVFAATEEGMTGTRFFNVGMNNTTMNGTNWDQPAFYTNGVLRRNNLESGAGIVMGNVSPVPYVSNQPNIMYHHFSDSTYTNGRAGSILGTKVNHSKVGEVTGGFIFGANSGAVTLGDDAGFIGSIGDLIVYGADSLTLEQRNRVDAYLAIKYGVTMDNASSYVSSKSDTVWYKDLDKSFYNNVAGLARDTTSALYQKQSRSQINNNPNDQVTIGLNTIAATNFANSATLSEGQFWMWGDNGNTQAMNNNATTYTEFAFAGYTDNRHMNRIWKVRNTNNITDSVLIRFPQASVGTTTFPSEGPNAAYVIIFATDSAISNNLVVKPLTVNGTDYEVKYEIPAGVKYFTFGKLQDVTLPIALSSFTAKAVENTAVLNWITKNERNSKGFDIQHSNANTTWETIGFVSSLAENGNSNEALNYNFVDQKPNTGMNFYRLKQIDFNGHFTYSATRMVQFSADGKIMVFPNPTSGNVTISGMKGDNQIIVTNAIGQEVMKTVNKGEYSKLIDLSHFAAGFYMISISNASGEVSNFKVSKQ